MKEKRMEEGSPLWTSAPQREQEDPVGDILSMIRDIRAYLDDPANMPMEGASEPPAQRDRPGNFMGF